MTTPFGFGPGAGSGSGGSGSGDSGFGGFGGFSGFGGGGGDDGAPFLRELEKLMSWQGGPVNWDLASQLAHRAIAQDDPLVTGVDEREVADALRLADLWLDNATTLPSGITRAEAWSRRRWLEATLPAWRELVDPVAGRVSEAMTAQLTGGLQALGGGQGDLPPELASALPAGMSAADLGAAAGPIMGMMKQMGGLMFGGQVGQALGGLAGGVSCLSEVGLPLGPAGVGALLPAGVRAIGAGLDVPPDQVRLFLALREAAHQRLFAHVPWLKAHLFGLVADYARGIAIDPDAIGKALSEIDPTNPESMQQALGSGVFSPSSTPAQEAALARLETGLALVEGWVDVVVAAATRDRLPSGEALREVLRRRRATGGPAEQAFGALVGLELRPRRLREASALWAALTDARGVDGRDDVWSTPDLLPSGSDLDDPSEFLGTGTSRGAGGSSSDGASDGTSAPGSASGAAGAATGDDPNLTDLDDPIAAIERLNKASGVSAADDPTGDSAEDTVGDATDDTGDTSDPDGDKPE